MKNPVLAGVTGVIRAYQLGISPWLAPRCRFFPSCSEYALTAVRRFGVVHGTRLAAGRICRCHPWGGSGVDEVPELKDIRPGGQQPRETVGH